MTTSLQVQSDRFPVPEKISDYYNPNDPMRRWEVMYGYEDKFYLTDKEREFFLKNIAGGAKIVQIGDITLTSSFKTIVPLRTAEAVARIMELKKEGYSRFDEEINPRLYRGGIDATNL